MSSEKIWSKQLLVTGKQSLVTDIKTEEKPTPRVVKESGTI